MSENPRTDAEVELCKALAIDSTKIRLLTELSQQLERELNAANKIIADAKAYIEDVGDDFPEDGLLAILERKVTHDALGISPVVLPKP
jgi:hypothetical protein